MDELKSPGYQRAERCLRGKSSGLVCSVVRQGPTRTVHHVPDVGTVLSSFITISIFYKG